MGRGDNSVVFQTGSSIQTLHPVARELAWIQEPAIRTDPEPVKINIVTTSSTSILILSSSLVVAFQVVLFRDVVQSKFYRHLFVQRAVRGLFVSL
jgi:hypothetical protein